MASRSEQSASHARASVSAVFVTTNGGGASSGPAGRLPVALPLRDGDRTRTDPEEPAVVRAVAARRVRGPPVARDRHEGERQGVRVLRVGGGSVVGHVGEARRVARACPGGPRGRADRLRAGPRGLGERVLPDDRTASRRPEGLGRGELTPRGPEAPGEGDGPGPDVAGGRARDSTSGRSGGEHHGGTAGGTAGATTREVDV